MRKIARKLSAMALCTVFASMQIASAAIDTGLNNAVINKTEGGYVGIEKGTNSATLNFNNHAHVNWDSLNVDKNETLNFNAVDGAKGLTIVNTVNKDMTKIYGSINSNDGIAKLIISNPNGMLYDGATISTAGDLMLTTQALSVNYLNGNLDIKGLNTEAINSITVKNSDFSVGGEFNMTAPSVEVISSIIKAGTVKFITADGQNYLVCPGTSKDEQHKAVRLESVSIDGNVYIVSGSDLVNLVQGGEIKGNLNIDSDGNVALNYTTDGDRLHVTGDVNVANDGRISYLRNADVDGNVKMSNSGGFLEVKDITTKGNVDLTTTVKTNEAVKHFVHVVGNNKIDGDLKVDSIHNIHIGGYDSDLENLANGKLEVGGNIDALAREGSVKVTVDTSADKIALTSGTLNVMTNGKANLKANEYKFKAKHYIGGVSDEAQLIDTMENYKPITGLKGGKSFVNIEGGNVTKIETDPGKYAFVRANKSMKVTGVDAGTVNLSAGQDIEIGENVSADLVQVDGETRNLKVELPSRDYTLKYTNIKDTKVITVDPNKTITYDMANGKNGWNKGTQTKDNTYLIVPGEPVTPPVKPEPKPIDPQDNDNVKVMKNLVKDQVASAVDANQVYTPVAFAADLDDEIETGVRKNVDGSVTVVRPFTPTN